MRKKLLITLFLLFSFIPVFSVSALTGNDGVEYPEAPDGRTRYVIYQRKDGEIRLVTIGNDTSYVSSGYWQPSSSYSSYNTTSLYFYKVPVSTGASIGCQDYDPTICTVDHTQTNYSSDIKLYYLDNDVWVYKEPSSIPFYVSSVNKILYSTENIYYRTDNAKSTYPEESYFIPGEHGGNWTKTGLEHAYEDLTYKANEPLKPFEELLPTSLYKGLMFSFNTSNVSSDDILSFNYNFYSSDENYNVLNSTFEIPYFGYNGKDIYSDGSYTLNYQTNQLDSIPKNNYVNDNFLQNFKYFDSEYKLFVNFEMLEDNYLYAYLDSPLNYTVEYIEREENLYYFEEIDITGKYGVVFIPNDINNDYVSVMKFSEKGKYSVQLRDSYSETNENYNILEYYQIGFCDNLDVTGLVPVQCIDSYFLSLNNYFREKKQFVYVKNENNYDSSVKSVITYDTRYYTAYIQEYSNSNIEIINPNTGETDIFGPMTDFDNIYYEISNDNILELMKTFLNDLQQTSDTFNYMWNNFYAVMPNILKAFLQVITHLLCIWVFMKIVGYD